MQEEKNIDINIDSDQIVGLGCAYCKETEGYTIDYRYRKVSCNTCGKKSRLDETLVFLVQSERLEIIKQNEEIKDIRKILKREEKLNTINQIVIILLGIAIIFTNL